MSVTAMVVSQTCIHALASQKEKAALACIQPSGAHKSLGINMFSLVKALVWIIDHCFMLAFMEGSCALFAICLPFISVSGFSACRMCHKHVLLRELWST